MTISQLIENLQELERHWPQADTALVFGTYGLRRPIGRIEIVHVGGTSVLIVAGAPDQ